MALKSTITAPPVIEGVTQVNSNGDTIIANPVVLVDSQGEFITLSNGKIPVEVGSLNVSLGDATLEIANDVGNPIPINAVSLPLPSGAATSENQSTTNTLLASIDIKTPALGQALAANSTPVVLPAAQITALTPPTEVGITNTSFTVNAGTNLNTSALALESGGNLASLNNKLPSSLGPKTAVNSFPVTLSSDGVFAIAFGTASDSAAISDTANSGLISLFKRFLQRTADWGLSVTPWFTKSNTYFGTYTIAKNAEAVAYAAGDVYGTRFELISFGAANDSFFLTGVNLVSSLSTLPSGMGLFSLFLFDSEPTLIADNGAFILASSSITPQGIPLNSLSLITNSINSTSQTSQINELFRRGSSTLYGYLVTQSAFTPTNSAASTMTITLKAIEA